MKIKYNAEDILYAGRDLMTKFGYNGTSIRAITKSINIPKGCFYNYFSSKEEFTVRLIRMVGDQEREFYRRSFKAGGKSAISKIIYMLNNLHYVHDYYLGGQMGSLLGNLSAEMASVSLSIRMALKHEFMLQEELIGKCIENGQANGEVKSELCPKQTAIFILDGLHGKLIRMKCDSSGETILEFKKMVLGCLKP